MTEKSSDKHTATNGYALLIGVHNYRAFDASGLHDLKAGWNDARALWIFCIRAGFRPEDIHVLASPGATPGDPQIHLAKLSYFEEVRKHTPTVEERAQLEESIERSPIFQAARNESPPTHDAIVSALQAMREHGEKHPGAPLLLSYSGHGARTPDGDLALCPEDIDASLARAIPFAKIREILGGFENLTVLLDCCDAPRGTSKTFRQETSLSSSDAAPKDASMEGFRGRVLCAAGRSEHAHQAVFDDATWRSVFTQSLTSNLWRYRIKQGGALESNIVTYGELMQEATHDLMRWQQKPRLLSSSADVASLRLFQRGSTPEEGPTELSRKVRTGQLVPDFKYIISSFGTVTGTIAEVLVVKERVNGFPDGVSYTGAQEVWYVITENLVLLKTNKYLSITSTKIDSANMTLPKAGLTKICAAKEAGNWGSKGTTTYIGGTDYFFVDDKDSLALQLNITGSGDKMSLAGVTWLAKAPGPDGIKPGYPAPSMWTQSSSVTSTTFTEYYRGKSW